ncbi:acetyl-CoA hydrolase/transferase family protein [Aminicella lysinilytica]|uniref:Succinyl-CoA:acetate CoA-transferase n=1 Tax=Aminicella lysinilytica TaxID=433323 RepID=A0A4R6QDC5_9FIRM|nr:acetyl-CoA hydrolase/transferase family protein [Aminicella lysinilytica]NLD11312.1 acetyl-CoA hydrolase/transferase family protein [Clostridiales bacterium]TDP59863.1 succinyl-CoA:acetate CoA-transferase [Aminicella lysinilytica]
MELDPKVKERLRSDKGASLIMSADEAAAMVKDGMVLGVSGFTASGYPKAVPHALAERGKRGEKFKVDVYSGASLGSEIDTEMTEAGILGKRMPYMTDKTFRKAVNTGACDYVDMHLSQSAQYVNYGVMPKIDMAIVEALAINEDGSIVPTTSVGNTPSFIRQADKVIVELNTLQPLSLEGMHDCIILDNPPNRKPINITKPNDRIGKPYMECGWDKIAGIVITDIQDGLRPLGAISEDSQKIADNIIEFLNGEVKAGRLTDTLLPIQSGVGSVANAVLYGLLESDFHDMTCFTEVVQDSMLELIKAGKVNCASTTAITPSPEMKEKFDKECELYKGKLVFRPEDISNNPELIRRLGVISMNTALECDIYGNVNSTHVNGSGMMNGIGGSGDFSRNAAITIFSTVSTAKHGDISSIVPFCSHIDHTEHDVMVIVTEQGFADLRGCTPKERAVKIIQNCAHPDYRDKLMDYFERACKESALQTPHLLDEAFSWHIKAMKTGSMK